MGALVRGRRTHAEQNLERLSYLDGLISLPNRRAFDREFNHEQWQAIRSGTLLSLLFIDVDGFKGYNDRYGYARGDDVLRAFAGAIASTARRPRDFVARYGGDELTVILPENGEADALDVAEAIRKAVAGFRIEHGRSSLALHPSASALRPPV